MLLYETLAYVIHRKTCKTFMKRINLKHHPERGVESLTYLMDHILYQIFKINLSISLKNMKNG